MSQPTQRPQGLAQSLSDELHQSSQSDRAETIRELQAIIDAAPERSDFTDTKKILVRAALGAMVCLGLAAALAGNPEVKAAAPIGLGALGVFGAIVAFQHRKDGNKVLMTLTRTELLASNLSAPFPLSAIHGVELVDATHAYTNLHVDADAKLPRPPGSAGSSPARCWFLTRARTASWCSLRRACA
ncbi:hypothetical protein [Nannocystis pusilla]|uniref:hypothetical protein n=1 Tax=Nannocystis pusilla TaxID=889268 RepID=UPI003B780EAE